jgi:hypothetical protein
MVYQYTRYKMMRNIMYNTNDITKYCAYAKCQKQVEYAKVKTSGNDPKVSQKMRYAQYLRQSGVRCTKLLDAQGQIINDV